MSQGSAQPLPADARPGSAAGDAGRGSAPGGRDVWPEGSLELAEALQRRLTIGDRDWHALKAQRPRRAAEQIAAALVQLLASDVPAQPAPTAARERAIALLDHGLAWLRAEVSDPGCPSHGR